MRCARVAVVSLAFVFLAGFSDANAASEEPKSAEPATGWEQIWDRAEVDVNIRGLIRSVDVERMSKHLFYLAKDPLPCRNSHPEYA